LWNFDLVNSLKSWAHSRVTYYVRFIYLSLRWKRKVGKKETEQSFIATPTILPYFTQLIYTFGMFYYDRIDNNLQNAGNKLFKKFTPWLDVSLLSISPDTFLIQTNSSIKYYIHMWKLWILSCLATNNSKATAGKELPSPQEYEIVPSTVPFFCTSLEFHNLRKKNHLIPCMSFV
jgi:hypothetical protein